jgi:acetylornithine deacetylase/succinyl-diaminopimelate desuccinylase-like protein
MMRRTLLVLAILCSFAIVAPARAQVDDATKKLAHDIFKQLIEINTTDSVGNVTTAAEAMAQRLRDAGFPDSDIQVIGPNDRKKNMVARIHGAGTRKPILFICHLDVVEARREDWSFDPFTFLEKDGYFYGRGTEDIKEGDAFLVTTFMRLKKEGYRPAGDIILALTADEEGGVSNGVDWLLKNHRDLIEAEFILNPDAGDFEMDKGKRLSVGIQASEKLYTDFQLEVHNKGGHSSLPVPDNAI